MAREFAKKLYKSKQWQNTREAYMNSVGRLCERCYANGFVKPAEIVHHKIHLDAENIKDPSITLDWENLEALCRQCHADEHDDVYHRTRSGKSKRYYIDEDGSIIFSLDR